MQKAGHQDADVAAQEVRIRARFCPVQENLSGVAVIVLADCQVIAPAAVMEVDRFGLGMVIEQAFDIASDGTEGIYLSFDIDSVDPGQAPGTGTLKRGGLTYREAHLLMELVADSQRLLGLDLVEVNPLEDMHNATAELAVELISSAMGKNIY